MSVLTTGDLTIPTQVLEPWINDIQNGSAVATLSNSIPMKFGAGQAMVFDIGEAEHVAEGANKGPSQLTSETQTVDPQKFHKTVRWTEEVKWADEDYQLGVLEQILALIQPSLSRALDFGVFHGINPTSGAVVGSMQALTATTNSVEYTAPDASAALDAADELVLGLGYVPSDVALDPSFASVFATARTADGVKIYPELSLRTSPSGTLDGHTSSVSRTVGAVGVAAAATNVKAFVGDFSAIRWGIQRQIGLELIEYGDPDGQGDLKRNNQVAFRAEVVYGWGIAELDAFAKIVDEV